MNSTLSASCLITVTEEEKTPAMAVSKTTSAFIEYLRGYLADNEINSPGDYSISAPSITIVKMSRKEYSCTICVTLYTAK